MAGCCEHGDESSGSTEVREHLDVFLKKCWFLAVSYETKFKKLLQLYITIIYYFNTSFSLRLKRHQRMV